MVIYFLRVQGDSMSPTLREGQALLALSPRLAAVQPGRIIAFAPRSEAGEDGGELYLKRVLSREGEGWFVVGDNPARSRDSRRFGPVPDAAVRAVAVLQLGPLRRL